MLRTIALISWLLLLQKTAFLEAFSTPAPSSSSSSSSTTSAASIFSQHFPDQKSTLPHHELLLTYLEINGFLITTAGVTILIDPLLEGPLDFGIPDLYTGEKKNLPSGTLCESLPPIDCILITQGLDDHAHVRTLTKLATDSKFDNVPIVAPPSAKRALEASGILRPSNVQFLKHGQRTTISCMDPERQAGTVDIRATQGALVGPPWQTRENGYILRPSFSSTTGRLPASIYIEPHVEFQVSELQKEAPIDCVITPIVGQRLPILDLVYGPRNSVELIELLKPKVVIPMPNANINQSGAVSSLVKENGSEEEFFNLLAQSKAAGTKVQALTPGRDEIIQFG